MGSHSKLLKKVADPEGFRVIWWLFHTKARRAVTYSQIMEYIRYVKDTIEDLPCDDCKQHAKAYLRENPMENFINVKDERSGAAVGMSKYMFMFHNHVNRRTGKKEITWATYLTLYYDEESITETCKNCGKNGEKVKLIPKAKYP